MTLFEIEKKENYMKELEEEEVRNDRFLPIGGIFRNSKRLFIVLNTQLRNINASN
jgi:hypothetical protein